MQTISRENYLKAILKLEGKADIVSNQALADKLETKPASVTSMLHKLAEEGWVKHEAYKGAQLTAEGKDIALATLRKHRLWEVFLVEKLNFGWDVVHQWAEELEHIGGEELTNRLDAFLGYPAFDPHGDPIPNALGKWKDGRNLVQASQAEPGSVILIKGVLNSGEEFLQHLNAMHIQLGLQLIVVQRYEFDDGLVLEWPDGRQATVSHETAQNILVEMKQN